MSKFLICVTLAQGGLPFYVSVEAADYVSAQQIAWTTYPGAELRDANLPIN